MRELFFIIIVALISIRYLFVPGFLPTHDGEYHLIRLYEFESMLAAGHLFPRWAPGLNSGYGVPLFLFFYPLPNYLAAIYHIAGWNLADSLRFTMATGYLTAVLSSYFWLRRLFGAYPAVVASSVGAFTPYWFVDIFVRGSVGEIVALGFVFAALACVAYRKKILLAFAIAAIILGHNIMAMIALPILFLYGWVTDRSSISAMVLGILLSAYFWMPALGERGNVVGLNTVAYRDHFPQVAQLLIPSWGTGFSGSGFSAQEMSYQIGIIPLFLFLVALLVFPLSLFTVVVMLALFLMLEWSVPVWNIVTPLALLQYPWRLLSVFVIATPYFAAALTARFGNRLLALGMVGSAIAFTYSYTKPVLYAPRSDNYYLSRREFTDGTSSLGNSFSTRWMPWRNERPPSRMEIVSGAGSIVMSGERATTFVADATIISDAVVRINVAYYPGWQAVVDGRPVPVSPDDQGTVTISVPRGNHAVKIYFSETPLRWAADLASLIGLFWLMGSTILKRTYGHWHRYYASSNGS